MRRTFRERRQQLYRGMAMPRVATMFFLLAIMGLMFVKLRDPQTWRWFDGRDENPQVAADVTTVAATAEPAKGESQKEPAEGAAHKDVPKTGATGAAIPPQGGNASGGVAAKHVEPELKTTGPTDQDPQEMADMDLALSFVTDGTEDLNRKEEYAFYKILKWVEHQPAELLQKRGARDVLYTSFTHHPRNVRLQLVDLKLNVRQIVRMFKTGNDKIPHPILSSEGKPLFEVHGVTDQSVSNLYFAVVPDLPPDMPIGTNVNEDVRLVGYFFKVQGYISGQQQLDAEQSGHKPKPLLAPLIIGRLIWSPPPAETAETTPLWVFLTLGGVAVIAVLGWVYWGMRRPVRISLPRLSTSSTDDDPEAPNIDEWLDQAHGEGANAARGDVAAGSALGTILEGRFFGNIFDETGDSINGRRASIARPSGNGSDAGHEAHEGDRE